MSSESDNSNEIQSSSPKYNSPPEIQQPPSSETPQPQTPQPQIPQFQRPQPQQTYIQQHPLQLNQGYGQQHRASFGLQPIPQTNAQNVQLKYPISLTDVAAQPQTVTNPYPLNQQNNNINLKVNPQPPIIQIQNQNPMFQSPINQFNQIGLINQNQQEVTIENSLTFKINWTGNVVVKFLVDLFIFTRLLSYQYGLIDFLLRNTIFNLIYKELYHWTHVIMSAIFIWANLGCGYSYRNSKSLKRFHYIMLGLTIYELLKYILHIFVLPVDKDEIIYRFHTGASALHLISMLGQKISCPIILGISILFKR